MNTPQQMKIWRALPAVLLFCLMILCSSCSYNDEQAPETVDVAQGSADDTAGEDSSEEIQTPKTESGVAFVEDNVVDAFITNFNSISSYPLENIEKGNINTKYNAISNGYYFEMLHANDTDKISVSISQTNGTAPAGVSGMKSTFIDVVRTIDASVAENDISSFFDSLLTGGIIVEKAELGKTLIDFVPDKELSNGHSRGHIVVAEI